MEMMVCQWFSSVLLLDCAAFARRSTLSKIEEILHSIGKVLLGKEIPNPWRVEAGQILHG
jgi:hypothetical protein